MSEIRSDPTARSGAAPRTWKGLARSRSGLWSGIARMTPTGSHGRRVRPARVVASLGTIGLSGRVLLVLAWWRQGRVTQLRHPMDNAAGRVTVARWGQWGRGVPCVA